LYFICLIYISSLWKAILKPIPSKKSFFVSGVTTFKKLDRKEKRLIPLFANNKINMEKMMLSYLGQDIVSILNN
jgi:hypothetical protein